MTLDWTIAFAGDALEDLSLIENYLIESYAAFGESDVEARAHAEARVEAIISAAERIGTAPRRGTSYEALLPGLRQLTIDRAVYWFNLDEARRQIRILAIFFGAQNHQRRMLVRLLGDK